MVDKRRKLYNMDNEMDQLLHLEEEYYRQGFEEGQEESTKKQYLEGKEYGYQTGFQRFLIIGYINGLIEVWYKNLEHYNIKSLENHLIQLKFFINEIKLTNNDKDVENYEKLLIKLRNKMRIICNLVKEQWKFKQVDDLIKEIGGQLQLNENIDEIW